MKRTGVPATRLRTASTTSTTGPQVRLVQNFGVANVTTNGTLAAIASATETRSIATSGGVLVVSASRSPPVDRIVGVRDAIARSPTSGAFARFATTRSRKPWISAPSGCATTQYVPARGTRKRATKIFVTSQAAAWDVPGTPTSSSTACV